MRPKSELSPKSRHLSSTPAALHASSRGFERTRVPPDSMNPKDRGEGYAMLNHNGRTSRNRVDFDCEDLRLRLGHMALQ